MNVEFQPLAQMKPPTPLVRVGSLHVRSTAASHTIACVTDTSRDNMIGFVAFYTGVRIGIQANLYFRSDSFFREFRPMLPGESFAVTVEIEDA